MPRDSHPMTMLSAAILCMQRDSVYVKRYNEGLGKNDPEGASYTASGLADLAIYEGRFSDAELILTLGAAASTFGVEPVLIASPIVLLALAYALVQLSFSFAGRAPSRRLDVFSTFWHEAPAAAPPPEPPPGR